MAAPLRLAFVTKFTQFSRFSTRPTIARDFLTTHKWTPRRILHNDSKFTPNSGQTSQRWSRKVGGFVVLLTAGATTVVTFGMMGQTVVDVARRGGSVTAADRVKEKPQHRISREVKNEKDETGLKLTLYQYQTCPFCCKVRAFLDYHGLSYNVVEVNSVTRKQLKWSEYRKVPILVVDGIGENGFLQLRDSSVIISILTTFLYHRNKGTDKSLIDVLNCYPALVSQVKKKTVYDFPNKYHVMYYDEVIDEKVKKIQKEERRWRAWADDTFVHALSPNIYRTPAEAMRAFKYFSKVGNWEEEFSAWERWLVIYVGSIAMYFVGKMLKRRHNLEDDVRLSLYRETSVWLAAVGNKRTFMGGDEPNLADLAVYGTLVAIEGCDAFQDLLDNTKLSQWYSAMQRAVTQKQGSPILEKKNKSRWY